MTGAIDDASWPTGAAGSGTPDTPGTRVRTEWKAAGIWLRRTFTLNADQLRPLQLELHHDEDADVYLNGILAARAAGFVADYGEFAIAIPAAASLHPGTNTLAVHCHQTAGGQYIDVGILQLTPAATRVGP